MPATTTGKGQRGAVICESAQTSAAPWRSDQPCVRRFTSYSASARTEASPGLALPSSWRSSAAMDLCQRMKSNRNTQCGGWLLVAVVLPSGMSVTQNLRLLPFFQDTTCHDVSIGKPCGRDTNRINGKRDPRKDDNRCAATIFRLCGRSARTRKIHAKTG